MSTGSAVEGGTPGAMAGGILLGGRSARIGGEIEPQGQAALASRWTEWAASNLETEILSPD